MVNFKEILLHIFSQTEGLKNLPDVKPIAELEDIYKNAIKYASAGEVQPNDSPKHLQSIFDGLAGADEKGYFFEPKVLSLEDFNFPNKAQNGNTKDVFDQFSTEYRLIENFEGKAYAETCLALLEKYFCYVPSPIKKVSLYDYLKSVAAFMVCLQQSESFLLVGGDISGIQAFIYDIISKNASKNLKGRSFYLQILVDAVLRKILNDLGLFSGNIIYASGGGFYILAPNTNLIVEKLKKIEKDISDAIYKTHKTAFNLAIAWEPLSEQSINIHWDNLITNINKKQKQKFKFQIEAGFDDFFADNGIEVGGIQERDAITGEEFEEGEKKYPLNKDEADEEGKIKRNTYEQIELGSDLRNAEYLLSSDQQFNYGDLKIYSPCDLGIYFWFANNLEDLAKKVNSENVAIIVNTINLPKEFLQASFQKSPNTYNFSFYGGNDYPSIRVENRKGNKFFRPKTFSEMAGQKDEDNIQKYVHEFKETPFKRFGVLRMDVDNLGSIFSKDSLGVLARYSTLSRSLDYFFKGYLNVIWRENIDFKESTQIIYSGGDDLFIIGRWDYLIEFAEKIQEEFERWTCHNENLGISGGISIVTPKFPISKAADISGEYENKAKKHKYPKVEDIQVNKEDKWEKNSICIFGKSLHWKNEFPTVKRLKDKFFELGDDVKATSMKIQGFHAEKESILEDLDRIRKQEPSIRKDHTFSWRWQLAYDIARAKDRYKNKKELKEFLDEIKIDIFTKKDNQMQERKTEYEFFDLLALAARWAELERRTKK